MNTYDKTLLGLSCHARSKCSECPYEDMPECSSKLAADAEKMYKQLERERDAALDDLSAHRPCDACGYYELQGYGCMRCRMHTERPMWKWRGVEVE